MDLGIIGKRSLVSGADSGIGFHTARRLLTEGTVGVMTDHHPDQLQAAAERLDASRATRLPYCAAKAGVLRFAEGLSRSYASEALLVNCVSRRSSECR